MLKLTNLLKHYFLKCYYSNIHFQTLIYVYEDQSEFLTFLGLTTIESKIAGYYKYFVLHKIRSEVEEFNNRRRSFIRNITNVYFIRAFVFFLAVNTLLILPRTVLTLAYFLYWVYQCVYYTKNTNEPEFKPFTKVRRFENIPFSRSSIACKFIYLWVYYRAQLTAYSGIYATLYKLKANQKSCLNRQLIKRLLSLFLWFTFRLITSIPRDTLIHSYN